VRGGGARAERRCLRLDKGRSRDRHHDQGTTARGASYSHRDYEREHRGADNSSRDNVEPTAVQLRPYRVGPVCDGCRSVLSAGTVLIPGSRLWPVRRWLYRNHGPLDVQRRLSAASRWRADDHAGVHAYARGRRESRAGITAVSTVAAGDHAPAARTRSCQS
jgi:hypothetical protein